MMPAVMKQILHTTHEINNVVGDQKSVWLAVNRRATLPGKESSDLHDNFPVGIIKDYMTTFHKIVRTYDSTWHLFKTWHSIFCYTDQVTKYDVCIFIQ